MNGLLYSTMLQWKLDLRSRTMLIACYVVPLAFFAFMSGVFTSVMPGYEKNLIQSMTVFAVSMGALIGLPPSLVEMYGNGIRRAYEANGVPLAAGVIAENLSALIHLLIMSLILYVAAPLAFDAVPPAAPAEYFAGLLLFTAASLGIASMIGLGAKDAAVVPMISILVFLPSTMLSGLMFPADLLPDAFRAAGVLFPATWGYRVMSAGGFVWGNTWPLLLTIGCAALVCLFLLKRIRTR